jgi:hypothetical protein
MDTGSITQIVRGLLRRIRVSASIIFATLTLLCILSGCASNVQKAPIADASNEQLRNQLVRIEHVKPDSPQSLALYLKIAEVASMRFANKSSSGRANDPAVNIYNRAVADFIESWSKRSRPTEIHDDQSGEKFRLISLPEKRGTWSHSYFNSLQSARGLNRKTFRLSVVDTGIGGTLIGIHQNASNGTVLRRLEPPRGFRMAVTGVLVFKRNHENNETETEIELLNPRIQSTIPIVDRNYPLAADFTAPLASYPRVSELWAGFVNMVRGAKTEKRSGLYMLEPYDPNRIPVVLVHGLLSSGYTWLSVGNEIQNDPQIRKRYQFWVFFYPTGNPILYSALRLREDLAFAQQQYGMKQGVVLIGHSMGGIISRLQVTDVDPSAYKAIFGKRAETLLKILESDPKLKSAFLFRSNPAVKRVIFISTPHRGSAIASGGLGALGDRIIKLPSVLMHRIPKTLLIAASPNEKRAWIPTSIDGLSPKSPLFKMTDQLPLRAPYHSIIGDRGKGDTPNSSDGVVPYWSSHLANAQSELIVPTGHGALKSPLAIAEVRRILRLHAGLR